MEDKVINLATKRKTSRIFKKEKPPIDDILYALETARQAPSGSNLQPTTFLLVDDLKIRAKVRAASEEGERRFYESLTQERKSWYAEKGLSWRKPNLEEAPILLVFVADTSKANYFASAWVSVAYTLLALEERGLSTVTYTPSNSTLVGGALELPKGQQVITILPIGYDADPKNKEPRKPLEEITRLNHWETHLKLPSEQ